MSDYLYIKIKILFLWSSSMLMIKVCKIKTRTYLKVYIRSYAGFSWKLYFLNILELGRNCLLLRMKFKVNTELY